MKENGRSSLVCVNNRKLAYPLLFPILLLLCLYLHIRTGPKP